MTVAQLPDQRARRRRPPRGRLLRHVPIGHRGAGASERQSGGVVPTERAGVRIRARNVPLDSCERASGSIEDLS